MTSCIRTTTCTSRAPRNFATTLHVSDQKTGYLSVYASVSMICWLIGSANNHCILFATTKYLDELPQKTLIEAKESSSTQVKLTPREQVSCPAPETDDPLAEGEEGTRTRCLYDYQGQIGRGGWGSQTQWRCHKPQGSAGRDAKLQGVSERHDKTNPVDPCIRV